MEALDLLKKDWKRNANFKQVSEIEIYKMIHRSSSSIVKWIFIISIIEFVFWGVLSFFIKDTDGMKRFNNYHADNIMIPLMIIGYVALAYFFFQFFMNYKKISATDNSKKLIANIIKTRKTVYQYVWFNIIYGILSGIIVAFVPFKYDKDLIKMTDQAIKNGNAFMFYAKYIIVMAIMMLLMCGLIWLFYRLIYGILLKRLYKNYEELKKIDL
ncbi:MAG TPA: hypothetical protein VF677_04775 [Flavobacterium sp.]|jgi:uncharacterized membrane protein YhdT